MGQFNFLERKAAKILSRYPNLKRRIKTIYQHINYYAYANKDFSYRIHHGVDIEDVSDYFSVDQSPGSMFFGYFDTNPWNDSMDAAVFHEQEGNSEVKIAVYRGGHRRVLTTPSAWNYQQGSRTQWHPNNRETILLNDVGQDGLISKEVDLSGNVVSTFQCPIQAVDPQGRDFLSLNYSRLDRNRPDYGYNVSSISPLPPPDSDGLWLVNMDSNEDELIISLESLIDDTDSNAADDEHYVNHALFDPTGRQFLFIHRWDGPAGRISRLYVADREGNCDIIMDDEVVSHFCWLSESEVFVWGRSENFGEGYHIIDVNSGEKSYVDILDDYGDGHPSLSPDGRFIVTDTYPDRKRVRKLVLFDRTQESVTEIGRFFEPLQYSGETRCDLHPRWSPDGKAISIDSAFSGTRRSYILDVSDLVD